MLIQKTLETCTKSVRMVQTLTRLNWDQILCIPDMSVYHSRHNYQTHGFSWCYFKHVRNSALGLCCVRVDTSLQHIADMLSQPYSDTGTQDLRFKSVMFLLLFIQEEQCLSKTVNERVYIGLSLS